jgi:hypothetical protein
MPVSRLIGVLADLRRQADDAVKAGLTLEAFRARLDVREHRLAFTQGDPALDELWSSYFLFMSAARAFEESAGKVVRRPTPQ